MGVLTLADFRTEIQSSTGNRGIDNARLDRWINFGYLDLAGAIKFASLDDKIVIPTVASQANYAITGSPLLIRFVVDATSNLLLGWHTPVEYFRVKDAVTGTAAKWTREKDEIFIHPVPAGVVSLEVCEGRACVAYSHRRCDGTSSNLGQRDLLAVYSPCASGTW